MSDYSPESLTERFHYVRSMIPSEQDLAYVTTDAPVSEAFALMQKHNYTQLPVMQGKALLGIFSYRSYALGLQRMEGIVDNLGKLPVDEFVERLEFVPPKSNWEQMLNHLESDDAVLVGGHDNVQGVVTPMDVVRSLQQIASPFVLLAEIEQSLRRALRACVSDEELQACFVNAKIRKKNSLNELSFGDYKYLLQHPENWGLFSLVFGETDYLKQATLRRLEETRNIRNAVFHFSRKIEKLDIERLMRNRDWLKRRIRDFAIRQQASLAVPTWPNTDAQSNKWDESRFFSTLAKNANESEIEAARDIYVWALTEMPNVYWGQGKIYGSIVPGFTFNGIWHQLFGLWTNGYVEVQFQYMIGRPPFDNVENRMQLVEQFNKIDGVNFDSSRVNKRPPIPLSLLVDKSQRDQFLRTATWFLDQIKSFSIQKGEPKRRIRRYQFWEELLDEAKQTTMLHANISPNKDSMIQATAGVRGLSYGYGIRSHDARIELYIDRGDSAENQRLLEQLKTHQLTIETEFEDNLIWLPIKDKRASKIEYHLTLGGLKDREKWDEVKTKMIDAMKRFSSALQPHINNLDL